MLKLHRRISSLPIQLLSKMSSCHFHVFWNSRTLPVLVPMFKKWDHLVLCNYLGVTLLTFFGEASAMVQKRRLGTIVEPLVHAEGNVGSSLVGPHWASSLLLHRNWRDEGSFISFTMSL